MPGFLRDAGSSEHVFQVIDAVAGQGGNGFVRAGADADDRPIGQVVIVVDDGLEKFRIFAQHLGDVFEGADVGDGCPQAASGKAVVSRAQFHGSRSLIRLIL